MLKTAAEWVVVEKLRSAVVQVSSSLSLACSWAKTHWTILIQVVVSQIQQQQQTQPLSEEENQKAEFVRVVLRDTEDVWNKLFQERGETYQEPVLVLFSGVDQSGCGTASAAMGPFYCPEDSKVYIDLSFYDDLQSRFGAPGDFAMAYVVAHEVGHHVQDLWGISDKVHAMRQRLSEEEYNKLSVKLELQADFLAGVWAHHDQAIK